MSSLFKYSRVHCVDCGAFRWVNQRGYCDGVIPETGVLPERMCRKPLVPMQQAHRHLAPKLRPVRIPVEYKMWKQRDGSMIRIKDMDDHHVLASMAMMVRGAKKRCERAEAKQRTVCDVTDHDWFYYEYQQFLRPGYSDLKFEAQVRGLVIPEVCQ